MHPIQINSIGITKGHMSQQLPRLCEQYHEKFHSLGVWRNDLDDDNHGGMFDEFAFVQ